MKGMGLTYTLLCALLMAACGYAAVVQEGSPVMKFSAEAESADVNTPLYIKIPIEGYCGKKGLLGSTSGGVTYIRWGRTTCPDVEGTKLVYAGRAAGSHYVQKGGTSDYLCLPDKPEYLKYQAGVQNLSPLHGAEYESHQQLLRGLHDYNVPCAVCHSSTRGSLITVPAQLSCPNTWTLEYSGYLMTAYRDYYRTSTECMDKNSEAIAGSFKNTDGALFFHMEATCNGIQCPPYVPEKELTCAVCTK